MITLVKKSINRYTVLCSQQRLLEDHYPFLRCEIDKNTVLICRGAFQPDGCSDKYEVRIEYVVGHEPKTTICKPFIEPTKHIHMYKDRSICLSYPPDMKWSEKTKVFPYTIPWITEWIIFYELYKVTGMWFGKQSPIHLSEEDRNINKNVN